LLPAEFFSSEGFIPSRYACVELSTARLTHSFLTASKFQSHADAGWIRKVKTGMKKTGLVAFSLFFFATLASAQIPSANVFFGYSYMNTDLTSGNSINTNGWEASVEGKIIPFLGIVADFDAHYGSQSFPACVPGPGPTCDVIVNAGFVERNFLFGPRVSVTLGKIRPFGEVLIGAAHVNVNQGIGTDNSFATAVGGGVDYKLIPHIAWRLQGDYVRSTLFSTTQNNVRISTGIVARF
jgi:opacity protein-like surface antigen